MERRRFLLALAVAPLSCGATTARAQLGPGEQIDLTTTLEKGLKVRLQRERAFVQRVVKLVEQNVFSRELVLTIFDKARLRHARFPFVYFREMMVVVAKKQGVELPF